jgi:hypothetical protein
LAGYGRERQIDCIDWLIDNYGEMEVKWTKEKGYGFVDDEHGEARKAELHWYQEPGIGKAQMKSGKNGRWYLDD